MITKTYQGYLCNKEAWGHFNTLMLKQPDGYFIDLVARLNEAVWNYGKRISVRYWTAKRECSRDDLMSGALARLCGSLLVGHDAQEYSYSEYTSGVDYETILNIDNHNLYAELCGHEGRFVHLEVDFLDAKE